MPQSTARSDTERSRALGPANSSTTGAACSASMRRIDFVEAAAHQLEGDVARAHEGARPAAKKNLHAARGP